MVRRLRCREFGKPPCDGLGFLMGMSGTVVLEIRLDLPYSVLLLSRLIAGPRKSSLQPLDGMSS